MDGITYIEDIKIGDEAEFSRVVTAQDIETFAQVSGDNNPLHLDADYAATTMFKTRIAHGMLSAGYISAVVGTRLPGKGAIYVSQSLAFKAPVRIGDEVITKVRVEEVMQRRRRVRMKTWCQVGDTTVVTGEAVLMMPSRAKK